MKGDAATTLTEPRARVGARWGGTMRDRGEPSGGGVWAHSRAVRLLRAACRTQATGGEQMTVLRTRVLPARPRTSITTPPVRPSALPPSPRPHPLTDGGQPVSLTGNAGAGCHVWTGAA